VMEISREGIAEGRFNAVNVAMKDFAVDLSRQFGRVVVDATGLKDKYDFALSWTAEMGTPGGGPPQTGGAAPTIPVASIPDGQSGLTLFAAIPSQLGLKLESKKGPVDILVIDHFEKIPTEN